MSRATIVIIILVIFSSGDSAGALAAMAMATVMQSPVRLGRS